LAVHATAVAFRLLHRFVYAHHGVAALVDLPVAQRAVLQVQQRQLGVQRLVLARFAGVVDLRQD